jgi:hypothetical protein
MELDKVTLVVALGISKPARARGRRSSTSSVFSTVVLVRLLRQSGNRFSDMV